MTGSANSQIKNVAVSSCEYSTSDPHEFYIKDFIKSQTATENAKTIWKPSLLESIYGDQPFCLQKESIGGLSRSVSTQPKRFFLLLGCASAQALQQHRCIAAAVVFLANMLEAILGVANQIIYIYHPFSGEGHAHSFCYDKDNPWSVSILSPVIASKSSLYEGCMK